MKTMDFKKQFINSLIVKYKPDIVNMWEDRPNHAEEFSLFLLEKKKTQNIDFEVDLFPLLALMVVSLAPLSVRFTLLVCHQISCRRTKRWRSLSTCSTNMERNV